MRPAWWTIRGLTIWLLLSFPGDPDAPWVQQILSGAILVASIAASMRIGRNRNRNKAWSWLSVAVTVAGVLAGLLLLSSLETRFSRYAYLDEPYPYGSLTVEEIEFIERNGIGPEEYFGGGYDEEFHNNGPSPEPPIIIVP